MKLRITIENLVAPSINLAVDKIELEQEITPAELTELLKTYAELIPPLIAAQA